MSSYRFYYLNDHDHIIDAAWAPCLSDDAAVTRAKTMLADTQECRAIEIWQGTRRVNTINAAMTGNC